MKILTMILVLSVAFAATATADTITVLDAPAGIYDTLHAKLAVDRQTGRAYVRVFLVDESAFNACWGNQATLQGISTESCYVHIQKVVLPGLAHNAADDTFTFNGGVVSQQAVTTDLHHVDVDDGVSVNSIKHLRVILDAP
jgi:hypothetical protein